MVPKTAMFSPLLSSSALFLLALLLFLAPPTVAERLYYDCSGTGNYTANTTYYSNLHLLLSNLTNETSRADGFSTADVGQSPDQIYGLALCRGDTNTSSCRSCINTASVDIRRSCPYNKAAVIWYDLCYLRYANHNFLSMTDNNPQFFLEGDKGIPDRERFDKLVNELVNAVTDWAAFNSSRKFATGEVNFTTAFPKIYGLVQCTRDLTGSECQQCVQWLIGQIAYWFEGEKGGIMLGVRCNLRYGVSKFYQGASIIRIPSQLVNGTAPAPPVVPTPAGEKGSKKNSTALVVAIIIPLVAAVMLISIICICYRRRRRSTIKLPLDDKSISEEITSVESLLLDISTLRFATINFSEANKLGQGGFGAVYKGILPDGREIAVKRLITNSRQGLEVMKNELGLVAKLQHRNLVRLLGVCLEGQEKLLVYEYVSNKSLDTFLFDPIKSKNLNWRRRYQIIEGISRGLQYLHEDSRLKIIHRDLKASNILLDADMNPKISDFGLARLFDDGQTRGTTGRVIGTFGYIAPEYAMRGHFSTKSDIYSFGVIILEIVTGRNNNDFSYSEGAEDLLSCTWKKWTKGKISEILDPALDGHCPGSEVLKCVQIGLLCVQENPSDRPDISTVVLMLDSKSTSLKAPSRPALYMRKNKDTPDQSLSRSIPMSLNEVSMTELEPR